jgi:hypothetical protein
MKQIVLLYYIKQKLVLHTLCTPFFLHNNCWEYIIIQIAIYDDFVSLFVTRFMHIGKFRIISIGHSIDDDDVVNVQIVLDYC